MIQPEIYKIADDYIAELEREQQEEIAKVQELQDFWCQNFPKAAYMPPDKRFLWWVRTYDVRLLKYAIGIATTNLSQHLSSVRIGKYVSAVCRNVQAEAARTQRGAA
jgi:hypothetical protein